MFLGRVIGTVWATKKDENLTGAKFLIVRHVDLELQSSDEFSIAVDSVGAGEGEIVLVASGSSARQTDFTRNKPVDATIMAIVDKLDVSEEVVEVEQTQ